MVANGTNFGSAARDAAVDLTTELSSAPSTKLDAEHFVAEDVDGIVDSVMGSGNATYAFLQGQQTGGEPTPDQASVTGLEGEALDDISQVQSGGQDGIPGVNDANGDSDLDDAGSNAGATQSRLPDDNVTESDTGGSASAGNSSLGALGGSSQSGEGGVFNTASSSETSDIQTGLDGADGSSGTSGLSGKDGADGQDGEGSDGGGGDTYNYYDIDIDNDFIDIDTDISHVTGEVTNITNEVNSVTNQTVNNVSSAVNNTITNITNNGLNITNELNNLVDIDINENVENILDAGVDITNEITNIVDTDIVENLIDIDVDNIVDGAVDITNNVLNVLDNDVDIDILNDNDINILKDVDIDVLNEVNVLNDIDILNDNSIDIDIDKTVSSIINVFNPPGGGGGGGSNPGNGDDVDVDIDATLDVVGAPVLNETVDAVLDPVEQVIGDVDVVADVGAGLLGGGGDPTADDDTDLSIDTALQVGGEDLDIDVNLDPVEQVVGDIDADIGVVADIIDGSGGSIVTDGLGGSEDGPGDQDIDLDVAGALAGQDMVNESTEAVLDPVEDVIGDVDVLGDVDVDLFGAGDGEDDTDLSVDTGLDLGGEDVAVDVNLDPVEEVIGDIDVEVDVVADVLDGGSEALDGAGEVAEQVLGDLGGVADGLGGGDSGSGDDVDLDSDTGLDIAGEEILDLNVDAIIDPVEQVAGDIDVVDDVDVDLFGPGEGADDTDLSVDPDIEILDHDIVDGGVEVGLDPVESIIGDVDATLDVAADLLSPDGDSADTEEPGVDADDADQSGSLIEIAFAGDDSLVGDLGIGEGPDGGSADLPEPTGAVSEGLGGVLDQSNDLSVASLF